MIINIENSETIMFDENIFLYLEEIDLCKRVRAKNSEVNRLLASNAKAKKILKWKPEYGGIKGFKKGLEKTINWFSDPENLKFYNYTRLIN